MANNGQTSAAPQKHGNCWTVRVWKDGKHVREKVCPISGPDALDKIGRQKRAQEILAAANSPAQPTQGKIEPGPSLTVKVAGDSWLHHSKTRRRNPIRQNTVKAYGNNVNKWIYPVVGDLPLANFKSMQAKQVIDAMHEAGASTSVINDTITNMQQIIEHPKDGDGQPIYNWKLDRDVMDAPEVKKKETKAFTAEQIEQIIDRASGQYKVLFALLPAIGPRIGEALAIEIDANPETTTTLSKNCRVLYVNTIILQDGTKQDAPKTVAGVREVDIQPEIAAQLQELIGLRTSGYVFCTDSGKPILYSNLRKNVLDPILYGYERKKMKRVGKGWKQVGVEKHPGVLSEKAAEEGRYGMHSFRRFRATHLAIKAVNDIYTKFWLGHGKTTITELYQKIKQATDERRAACENAGLGFKLIGKLVAVKSNKKEAA